MSGVQEGTVLLEGQHRGEFLVSEARGYRSREVGTLTNGGASAVVYPAGLVLAMTAEPTKGVPATLAAYTATETAGTAAAILFETLTLAAGASAKSTIVVRDAEVNTGELFFDATVTTGAEQLVIVKQLETQGVIAR
jgi:hypothetical protein